MNNPDTPTAKKAREESEFGALYSYMSLYKQFATNDASEHLMREDIYNLTLLDICEKDFDANFKNTTSFTILEEYIKNNNITRSPWPALDGWEIQSYARTYALTRNPYYPSFDLNCTNFVSQALYNGGLAQTSYVGEENYNGIVDTTERWFNFRNSTSTGYSISSSWIRVEDLYSYLAPHYATGENHNPSDMNNYLNVGFVLQGKKWWTFKYEHSIVVTETNGQTTYCGNTSNRKDEPIQTFYDGYDRYRVIQTY